MKPIINQNTITQKSVTLFLMATLLLTFPTLAGYKLNWHTIDGGGGVSAGGTYIIRGTIGQPDAAYSEDGQYELLGSFWPGEPLCTVNFKDFAAFAYKWRLTAPAEMDSDLYQDGTIDERDLKVIADYWLCYCPYAWPLK